MRSGNYRWRHVLIVILGLFFASCAKQLPNPENIAALDQREISPVESSTQESLPQESNHVKDYILEVEDVLKIEFYYSPTLNRQQTIRPDGKITLPLKGDLLAAGQTPGELQDKIQKLFSDILKDPVVTVSVEGIKKRNKVYILGEVMRPDYYELDSPTTVTQLLARSGVRTDTANLDTVLVVSRNDAGKPVGKLVNVHKILEEADITQDIFLKRYDIVYVSKTAITKADLFVDQYINGLVPNLFKFTYNVGNGYSR